MSSSARVRWRLAVTVVLATLVTGLVAGELLARRALANARARVYRFSETRIYEPVPGARKVYRRPREGSEPLAIPLRFNRLGLRGPAPDEGRPRVVVFGDSFVEGRYVVEEESFVRRLEEALAARGRAASVWNAGVTGYGPDQSLLRLDAELETLDPDLVVFVVFAGNDFGDMVRNKLFLTGSDGWAPGAPVFGEGLRRSFAPPEGSALLQLLRHAPPPPASLESVEPVDAARLNAILERALACAAEEYDEVQRGDRRVRHPFRDLYDADLSLEPELPSARLKAELMESCLAAVAGRTRDAGVPLLFVFVPHLLDVCPGAATVDRDRWPAYRPSAKTDLLVAAARGAGAPALDLFPPFRGACAEELYFTKADDHWNARGQALAAELCAATILDLGLLR